VFFRQIVDAVIGEPLLPTLRAARCVRSRGGDPCRACELACPHEAVWLDPRGAWRLDAGRCDGCGACATACPSQAVDAPGIDADALARAWRQAERVTLGCARNDAPATVRLPCLAGLHPERLATLLIRHPTTAVVLDLSACAGCPAGALLPTIEAHARQARDVAQATGVVCDVRVARSAATERERVLDRRAFLRVARERTTAFVTSTFAERDAARPSATLPHRGAFLAATREQCSRTGAEPPLLPVIGAPFVAWEVAASCDGCAGAARPRCVQACPNEAWRVANARTNGTLTHDVAACSGCGACGRACPRNALASRPATITADGGRQVKRHIARPSCRECAHARATGDDGLCRHCRSRRTLTGSVRLGA
jgi:Fe-S-cluster-containing dehydrogenase component